MFTQRQIKKNYFKMKELNLTEKEFYVAFLIYQIKCGNKDAKEVYDELIKQFRHICNFSIDGLDLQSTYIPLLPEHIDNIVRSGLFIKADTITGKVTINDAKFSEIFITKEQICDDILDLVRPIKLQTMGTNNVFSAANIDNLKEFREDYLINHIDYSILEHKEILKDIQYGIDNNMFQYGIKKILANKLYLDWRKLRTNTITSAKATNIL